MRRQTRQTRQDIERTNKKDIDKHTIQDSKKTRQDSDKTNKTSRRQARQYIEKTNKKDIDKTHNTRL